ncbi:MAG: DUF72 domain-containing protein [Verrucomicrobiota bacterium]|nr:DUF72 domain-containing protein [Verrucomicrobiota bacterium]
MTAQQMELWIGTSGFQYAEWKGTFYPEVMPTAKMLPYYAERFTTTEINYSFHRIPSAKTMEAWWKATPARFKFSLKAPQKITHWAKLRNCGDNLRYFHQVICDLEKKLGCVLFQLPPTLKKDVPLLESFLVDVPDGMRAAIEFRDPAWLSDDVFELLKKKNLALCIADSEKLATPDIATADYGYLRLRREDYQDADIARWAEAVRRHEGEWSDAFIYFKHEESGIGPKFAKRMMELLPASAEATAR